VGGIVEDPQDVRRGIRRETTELVQAFDDHSRARATVGLQRVPQLSGFRCVVGGSADRLDKVCGATGDDQTRLGTVGRATPAAAAMSASDVAA
jgi:hypothetical protein